MTFSTKAASVAAIAMFTVATGFVGGISRADDTLPLGAAPTAAAAPSPSSAPAPTAYAVLQEGISPLSTPEPQADIPAPSERSHASLAALVADTDVSAPLDEQTRCLAAAVFYEARSETLEGQLAVARVIINRARSERFRPTLCGVVTQPGQFSFVRGGCDPAARCHPSALEARCGDQPYRACRRLGQRGRGGALFPRPPGQDRMGAPASGGDRQSRFLSLISKLLVIPA